MYLYEHIYPSFQCIWWECTHSKDLSHTRFMLVLQNAVPVLLYLAGPMDTACGCAINDHSDICLFKLLHDLSAEHSDCGFII